MPDLSAALDLLQRHHRQNRPVMNRGTPSNADWHSLPRRLREIREAAAAGDTDSLHWLATHGGMIRAVEACRAHDVREAVTYKGPDKR